MSPAMAGQGRPFNRSAPRAKTVGSWPRRASATAIARPRYPVPPVTSTFTALLLRMPSRRQGEDGGTGSQKRSNEANEGNGKEIVLILFVFSVFSVAPFLRSGTFPSSDASAFTDKL